MNAVEFSLDDLRGGRRSFTDLAEAILWAQQQQETWQTAFGGLIRNHPSSVIDRVISKWGSVIYDLQVARRGDAKELYVIEDDAKLVSSDAPIFSALLWSAEALSPVSFFAAASLGLRDGKVDWGDTSQAVGALLYERALNQILTSQERDNISKLSSQSKKIANRVFESRNALDKIEETLARVSEASTLAEDNSQSRLSELLAAVAASEFDAKTRLSSIDHRLERLSKDAKNAIDTVTDKSREEIESWFDAFKEQRKLEAPIKLWEERASAHEKALNSRRRWMVGVGALGLLLAGLVAYGSYELAKFVFEDAIVPLAKDRLQSSDGLRPSFRFELLLSSASTLIYLTMYLWTMKLLVRLYATEHHLGLDAKSRAALTETYLSFRQEGAATDADRAIMLGVIFRPVVDGMVKEDGPPPMSPAAILATVASANTKGT